MRREIRLKFAHRAVLVEVWRVGAVAPSPPSEIVALDDLGAALDRAHARLFGDFDAHEVHTAGA